MNEDEVVDEVNDCLKGLSMNDMKSSDAVNDENKVNATSSRVKSNANVFEIAGREPEEYEMMQVSGLVVLSVQSDTASCMYVAAV